MNTEEMRASSVFLYSQCLVRFNEPVSEGFVRFPRSSIGKGPEFSLPIEDLGTENLEWSNGSVSLMAMASKYVANVAVRGDYFDNVDEGKKILFSGGVLVSQPLELLQPEGYGVLDPSHGKIWTYADIGKGYEEEGGLRKLIFGEASSEPEMMNRVLAIARGYEVQDRDRKAAQGKRESDSYTQGSNDAKEKSLSTFGRGF